METDNTTDQHLLSGRRLSRKTDNTTDLPPGTSGAETPAAMLEKLQGGVVDAGAEGQAALGCLIASPCGPAVLRPPDSIRSGGADETTLPLTGTIKVELQEIEDVEGPNFGYFMVGAPQSPRQRGRIVTYSGTRDTGTHTGTQICQNSQAGRWLKAYYHVGGGGGHELYIYKMRLSVKVVVCQCTDGTLDTGGTCPGNNMQFCSACDAGAIGPTTTYDHPSGVAEKKCRKRKCSDVVTAVTGPNLCADNE
eukprot:g16828.t1